MRILIKNICISFFIILILSIFAIIENGLDPYYKDVPISELIIYNIVMIQGSLLLPFFIFYSLYDFLKRYLIKKDQLFSKYINQLLLGLGCLIIAIIVVSIFTITAFNQSFDRVYDILKQSILFAVLTLTAVTIEYFISKRRKSSLSV